jgi:phosphatidylglycerol lysyltransferase
MMLLGIAFSLIKGLSIVAPSAAAILLVGLLVSRRQFRRRASLLAQPLTIGWFLAIAAVVSAMTWILFFAFRDVSYTNGLWWQFEFDATAPRALRAVLGIAVISLTLGLWQLLRPASGRIHKPLRVELEHALSIADLQPRADALRVMMGDKSVLFSDSGKSFLMFSKRQRTWAALGDPVGPPSEWPELIWRFVELANSHGGRSAFYQVPPGSLPLYLDAGLNVLKIGEEARVFLPNFALDGASRAGLRYALRRGDRDGLEFEMIPADRVADLLGDIEDISDAWLATHASGVEKSFSVAAFGRDYVLSQSLALVRQRREVVAFATVMTTRSKDEAAVGLMRYRPDETSPYVMEYLFVRLLQHFQKEGYRSFGLGAAPLSGLHNHPLAPRWHHIGRLIWKYSRRFYNFQGLRTFKSKFDPIWEPRYLVASGFFGTYLALLDIGALTGGSSTREALRRSEAAPKRRGYSARLGFCLAVMAAIAAPPRPASALDAGNLGDVRVIEPVGTMRGVVVLFSDISGWTTGSDSIGVRIAKSGALVLGVDLPAYLTG